MIQEEEARARILGHLRALPGRIVPLLEAVDCFAAREISASLSLPHFDNSSMDGYAVVAASSRVGARLKVVGEQPAGLDRKLSLKAGEALRILTGAPIPAGADAVIMQEEARAEGDEIVVLGEVEPGENIRRRGVDVTEGQMILAAGERISPQTAALLAAQGIETLEVGGEVRAAIIATGDELAAPGEKLLAGQLYDSNSILLQALLRKCGVRVVSAVRCSDRAAETEAAIRAGLASEVMIITGGVSVGARDFVKPALSAAGVSLELWRVAVKPGKPFLFGRAGPCAIFGLPGNPVSAFVTWMLFVRPAILKLMGANDAALALRQAPAVLREPIRNPGERPHYVRGQLADGQFIPVGRQESHALYGLARANALLRVAAGGEMSAGESASVLFLD